MATKINKNMDVATIDPTSMAGNSQRRLFCPLIEVPIMSPTIRMLKERRMILKARRLLIRSSLCRKSFISVILISKCNFPCWTVDVNSFRFFGIFEKT
jgi:hypothetical protein